MKQILSILTVLFAVSLLPGNSFAQDAVKADPKHYKVEFENDKIRVLRITYGPGEKSVMHGHPDAFAVFLTDVQGKFTLPDGKTMELSQTAGTTMWTPAGKHLPENTGDKSFELILVEMKTKKK
ncbi:MAG TPA: cupin domain-containing protein [Bacteroidota bacterium]|nr:cupin domain-containing protein [Bacteroidota bacterium]